MWIIFGFISAFFDALLNINTKKNTKSIDSVVISWLWILCASPFLVLPALFLGFADTDRVFWIALSLRTILDTLGVILYVRALKESDISLSQPMLGLTPVFILFVSYFINGEVPSYLAVLGVMLISLGIYFNNKNKKGGFFEPILSIWKNKGTKLMFLVSLIYAGTSSLHSLAIKHSDPFTYTAIGIPMIAFLLTIFVVCKKRKEVVFAFKTLPFFQLIKIGIYDAVAILSQMFGQSLTQASYLIGVKRSSIVLTAFLAKKEFGEEIKNRIIPICLIIIGIILIVLK